MVLRKDYWNEEYYEYWKSRVDEANESSNESSNVIEGDTNTPDDEVIQYLIEKVNIYEGKILEIGCGWGRLFDKYDNLGLDIYGIDISKKMIEEAKKNAVKAQELGVAEAEDIPYKDNFFDAASCIATFDATHQTQALEKMLRTLKLGGKLLLTGKNINYHDDDKLAIEAEKGAREKGHPNFFTDVKFLKSQLKNRGHELLVEYYFPRRGDFANLEYLEEMPDKFYEYFMIIKKRSQKLDFNKFYNKYSKVMSKKGD